MFNTKQLSLLLFIFTLTNANLFAQDISLDWVGVFKGSNNYTVAFDINNTNEIVSTGGFSGVVDFNPGVALNNISIPGGAQATYVCKLDSNRNYLWSQRFVGPNGLFFVYDIKYDDLGNILICGHFNGTLDFDNSAAVYNLSSNGSYDAAIVKLDPNGNLIWAKNIGSSSYELARSIMIDETSNIYIVGTFNGIVDFDPNSGIENRTSQGNGDATFSLKLDSGGNFLFASCITSDVSFNSFCAVRGFNMTSAGELIITGVFSGTVDFDPGPSSYNITSSTSLDVWGNPVANIDFFIWKLDSSGQFEWVKIVKSSSTNYPIQGSELIIDQFDNIYCVGTANGTIDLDPGSSIFNLNASPLQNCLFKLNSDGDFIDAVLIPSEYGCRMAINDQNELFISGNYGYDITHPEFAIGIDTVILNSVDMYDNFLLKKDQNLNNIWVKSFGGVENQQVSILGLDQSDNLIMSSNLVGTMDFDPSSGIQLESTSSPSSSYPQNTYIAKYKPCSNTQSSLNILSCNDYTLNGIVYSISGVYHQVIQNTSGCDSLITLNLVISNSTSSLISATSCNSYSLNGQTYSASGVYSQIIQNATGCDSIITLDLEITNSSSSILTITSCDSFLLNGQLYNSSGNFTQVIQNFAGCDSTIQLNLTIIQSSSSTLTVSSCESYSLNGQTFNTSGIYTQVIQNEVGCDSIITLNLEIKNNTTNTLSVSACNSYTAPNNQVYNMTGDYQVVISNSVGCDSIIDISLTIFDVPTPEICMVTVDNQGLYNVIFWDKTVYTRVDSFIIYREVQNNIYNIIGVVPNDSLSLFVDTVRTLYFPNTGDPRVSSYKYKIAIKDTCGNISLMSPFHRTMFLQDQQNGNFNWNNYEIENNPQPIPQLVNYLLQRDDDQDGVFDITVGSTTATTATDPNYSSLVQQGSIWRIETDWNIQCNPTKQNNIGKSLEITSRSNKKNDQNVGLEVNNIVQTKFTFYPNAVKDYLFVSSSDPSIMCTVELVDLNGKIVLSSLFFGESTLDVKSLSLGSYLIKFKIPGYQENHLLLKN
jgi:hypothetical protein